LKEPLAQFPQVNNPTKISYLCAWQQPNINNSSTSVISTIVSVVAGGMKYSHSWSQQCFVHL